MLVELAIFAQFVEIDIQLHLATKLAHTTIKLLARQPFQGDLQGLGHARAGVFLSGCKQFPGKDGRNFSRIIHMAKYAIRSVWRQVEKQ
jgi:hypothetical protein